MTTPSKNAVNSNDTEPVSRETTAPKRNKHTERNNKSKNKKKIQQADSTAPQELITTPEPPRSPEATPLPPDIARIEDISGQSTVTEVILVTSTHGIIELHTSLLAPIAAESTVFEATSVEPPFIKALLASSIHGIAELHAPLVAPAGTGFTAKSLGANAPERIENFHGWKKTREARKTCKEMEADATLTSSGKTKDTVINMDTTEPEPSLKTRRSSPYELRSSTSTIDERVTSPDQVFLEPEKETSTGKKEDYNSLPRLDQLSMKPEEGHKIEQKNETPSSASCDIVHEHVTLAAAPATQEDLARLSTRNDSARKVHEMATRPKKSSSAGTCGPEASVRTQASTADSISNNHSTQPNPKDFWLGLLMAKRAGIERLKESMDVTIPRDLLLEINWGQSPQVFRADSFGNRSANEPSQWWGYYTNPVADEKARDAGVMLFERPPGYFRPQVRYTRSSGGTKLAPVIVHRGVEFGRLDGPVVEFDGEHVELIPRSEPWPDIRSSFARPDFLNPNKLAEYQACEASGYQVWCHNTDVLPCRLSSCGRLLKDTSPSTILCLGCGPKTVVRYCSLEHQLEGMETHWQECGDENLVMECVIDDDTEPKGWKDACPAIRECNGVKSWALHRQKLLSIVSGGHYTLFHPLTQIPAILFWPKGTNDAWRNKDTRIERLLNIACFDTSQQQLIDYLYRLLRTLIVKSNAGLNDLRIQALNNQFLWEFGRDVSNVSYNGPPCECEWYGAQTGRTPGHFPSCTLVGRPFHIIQSRIGEGLRAKVMELETRFWILRAWRTQHADEEGWWKRIEGEGFKKPVVGGGNQDFGPGWMGWGAPTDNLCD